MIKLHERRKRRLAGAPPLSPAFLGITGALAVLARMAFIIQRYQQHRKSVEDVREAYKNLDKTMANFSKRPDLTAEEQKRLEGVRAKLDR